MLSKPQREFISYGLHWQWRWFQRRLQLPMLRWQFGVYWRPCSWMTTVLAWDTLCYCMILKSDHAQSHASYILPYQTQKLWFWYYISFIGNFWLMQLISLTVKASIYILMVYFRGKLFTVSDVWWRRCLKIKDTLKYVCVWGSLINVVNAIL